MKRTTKVNKKSNRSVTLKRNPEKTRGSILDVATEMFAQHGFHGTALNDLCQKAHANKRMIYHYFDNKEGLYLAVHRRGWEQLGSWFAQELVRNGTPAAPLSQGDLLLEAVKIFHDFVATNAIFVRLLMWDGLEGGKASRALWSDIRGPLYRQIETLVVAGQRDGFLPTDLKPGHLIISFMGAVAFYYSHAHTMVDIFQKDPLSAEAVEERKEQIVALFRKLLQANPV
jgi:TetR/AcrR family transcriptional regulator